MFRPRLISSRAGRETRQNGKAFWPLFNRTLYHGLICGDLGRGASCSNNFYREYYVTEVSFIYDFFSLSLLGILPIVLGVLAYIHGRHIFFASRKNTRASTGRFNSEISIPLCRRSLVNSRLETIFFQINGKTNGTRITDYKRYANKCPMKW